MSEILVQVTRGPIVESLHRGDAVVVHMNGQIIHAVGDPFKVTYIRSAGKPLQTLNVILSGAADAFGFSQAELAIMCASHYGEAFHRKTILEMLEKLKLPLQALKCGSTLSIKPEVAKELIATHFELGPYNNDCSGKHVGMLATCLKKGYDPEGYVEENHPLQQDILAVVADMCALPVEDVFIGIDGCTVPVHGMPLYNMALGFAKFANPENLSIDMKSACERVFDAMNAAPEMVAGTDGFCTELIRHTNGKLVGKLGAEGVYCIGIKGTGLGLAIKIEDGNYSRAISPAVMRCLEDLDVLTQEELEALKSFAESENLNNMGQVVGKVSPAFRLTQQR